METEDVEIIQVEIPNEIYEKRVVNLIDCLLKLDGILFPDEDFGDSNSEGEAA
ncbi:MAG: hypothetical protein AB7O96_04980 [Pseudobdellovibrionaceae bacterium]